MNRSPLDLYERLPAVYRRRDAERGYPLRALLEIISEQANVVRDDVEGLLDNFFVQTADDWAVPYIGDLVDNEPLHELTQRRRVDVAKTIYYRRRKGTLPIIEEIARDVTGWGAHAVEFFELLGWTQNLNHLRYERSNNPEGTNPPAMDRVGTVNLRNQDAVDRMGGPFDELAHTADIRPSSSSRGWHNIDNLGLFLWRLQAYPMEKVPAKLAVSESGTPYGFHFSPLGIDRPLFTNPAPETSPTGLAEERHVPAPIRPLALTGDLEEYRRARRAQGQASPSSQYVGTSLSGEASFAIQKDGTIVDPGRVVCMDLEDWPRPPKELSYDGETMPVEVAVDVRRGRMSFAPGHAPDEQVTCSFSYGFPADVGGGPYDRRASFHSADRSLLEVEVLKNPAVSDAQWTAESINEGLDTIEAKWDPDRYDEAHLIIADNDTYEESLSRALPANLDLTLRAGEEKRPLVRVDPENAGGPPSEFIIEAGTGDGAVLQMNGLLIEGGIRVEAGSGLDRLEVVHSTLVPGRALRADRSPKWPNHPSLTVEDGLETLQVEVDRSITGPLRCPSTMQELRVGDSIVDASGAAPSARSTRVLVSGYLGDGSFPDLPEAPTLEVAIGDAGPVTLQFESKQSLSETRDELRRALRASHDSPAFTEALVEKVARKLVVVPGVPGADVRVMKANDDPTATKLRLVENESTVWSAVVSAPLDPGLTLERDEPQLMATIGPDGPFKLDIGGAPTTLAQVRDQLRQALRDAGGDSSSRKAYVIKETRGSSGADRRLVILASSTEGRIRFRRSETDRDTFTQLRLWTREAIGPPPSIDWFGPPATIERSTLFGETGVKALDLASEVIFDRWVIAERQQTGCVRFSYVPPDSRTPQRYECQPDLAVQARAEAENGSKLTEAEKEAIRARHQPSFTSLQFGDPAYAQLSRHCPEEIYTGGEDGAEMGVFNHLKQPQRETNLNRRLREYLPFGLDATLIYVT